MWRLLFIAFLIAHGLVHLAIWLMPKPADEKALRPRSLLVAR